MVATGRQQLSGCNPGAPAQQTAGFQPAQRTAGFQPAQRTAGFQPAQRTAGILPARCKCLSPSLRTAFVFLFCLIPVFCAASSPEPFRTIAILENERMLEAEPDITLSHFLESKDPAVRARAAEVAGRIGNPKVVPLLSRLATDETPAVRMAAAFALGQIRSKEGLAAVVELLKDGNPEVKGLALEAGGKIGGLEASLLILPFLDDPQPAVREYAALALALIKDKGVVDALVAKAANDDPAQWSYLYALYRLADERSVPALRHALANPSPSPSTGEPSSLLFALKALWSMKKPLTPEETERMLTHSDPRVQQNTLDVLAAAGDKAACAAIRKNMEKMASLHSQWKALDAIGALECSTVEERLKYLGHPEAVLRAAALKMIPEKERERYLPALDRAAQDTSWVVRRQAAETLAGLSADSAVPILKRLLRDADSAVSLAALESLGAFLPGTEPLLLPLLQGNDPTQRTTVLDALGRTKERKYLPALLEACRVHNDYDTLSSALPALAEYGDSAALAPLLKALNDNRYMIRKYAVDGLKKLTGSTLFVGGKAAVTEDFLFPGGRVSRATMDGYPADYGSPAPDREAVLRLQKGEVRIRLLGKEAPTHLRNFVRLAEKGFYNGLRIHRVVPNFVIQGGDPRGDGWGGAGELVPDHINRQPYLRGKLGMPTSGKDTGGCQFFITMSRQPHLDGNYTVFGEVISGMEFVDATVIGDRILSVELQ